MPGETLSSAVPELVVYAAVAGALAAGVLALWPWARARGRFALVGVATTAGFLAWNVVLNLTNAVGFFVDAPVIGLSWQDAGSGVLAFAAAALLLGLGTERRTPAARVVGAAAIAGLVAMIFDIFVL